MNENLVRFKQQERDVLNRSVKEFLNKGGVVDKIKSKPASPSRSNKTNFRHYIETT